MTTGHGLTVALPVRGAAGRPRPRGVIAWTGRRHGRWRRPVGVFGSGAALTRPAGPYLTVTETVGEWVVPDTTR